MVPLKIDILELTGTVSIKKIIHAHTSQSCQILQISFRLAFKSRFEHTGILYIKIMWKH